MDHVTETTIEGINNIIDHEMQKEQTDAQILTAALHACQSVYTYAESRERHMLQDDTTAPRSVSQGQAPEHEEWSIFSAYTPARPRTPADNAPAPTIADEWVFDEDAPQDDISAYYGWSGSGLYYEPSPVTPRYYVADYVAWSDFATPVNQEVAEPCQSPLTDPFAAERSLSPQSSCFDFSETLADHPPMTEGLKAIDQYAYNEDFEVMEVISRGVAKNRASRKRSAPEETSSVRPSKIRKLDTTPPQSSLPLSTTYPSSSSSSSTLYRSDDRAMTTEEIQSYRSFCPFRLVSLGTCPLGWRHCNLGSPCAYTEKGKGKGRCRQKYCKQVHGPRETCPSLTGEGVCMGEGWCQYDHHEFRKLLHEYSDMHEEEVEGWFNWFAAEAERRYVR